MINTYSMRFREDDTVARNYVQRRYDYLTAMRDVVLPYAALHELEVVQGNMDYTRNSIRCILRCTEADILALSLLINHQLCFKVEHHA